MRLHQNPIRILVMVIVSIIILGLSIYTVIIFRRHNPMVNILDLSAGAAEQAVRDTMQIQANNLQQFQILSNEIWGTKRILLYTYIVQPPQRQAHQEVGFALTEIRNGWSTIPGKSVADTQHPEPITYSTAQYNGYPIVFGRIRDLRVNKISAIFSYGTELTVHRGGDGVLITGPRGTDLRELLLYDNQGNVIKAYPTNNVSEPSKWK